MFTTPLLKDLYEHVTPDYAVYWKTIGILLGVPCNELKIIEHDFINRAVSCCNTMLQRWLETDPTATWEKLFAAIDSEAVVSAISSDSNLDKSKFYCICTYTHTIAHTVKYKSIEREVSWFLLDVMKM